MHRHHRFIWVLGLAVGLAVATCSFPTDKSDQVYTILTPSDTLAARGVIGQGQTELIFAQTWRRLPNGDSVEVLNVDYHWSSDNSSIVRVERRSGGYAEVTGANVGTVLVRAKAAAFEQSIDAAMPVRVSPSFIIDSVRPLTIGFGGKLSVFGVRVNQIFFMDQGFGTLIPDEFSFTGSLEGLGRLDFWVPFPSSSGHPFYFGPGVFGSTADSVTIPSDEDIFEPNYALPSLVDINGAGGPRTFLGFPTLFYNPALYYEPYDSVTDGPFAVDWYRFERADTTQAVTFIINSQVFDDTAFQYVADSISYTGSNYSATSWLNAPGLGFYICGPQSFGAVREKRTPITFVALRTLPGPAVHLFSNYGKDGPYSVVVVNGYLTQDRRIGPDRFEENENWCRWANENFLNSTDSTSANRKHIVVGLPVASPPGGPVGNGFWFDSTLTIDNGHDIDWYRIRIQGTFFAGADTITTIRSKARPFPGAGFNFSDIDLYLRRASDMGFVANATTVGSNEVIQMNVPPGDYFLGVVDAAGTPTRYSLCIVKSLPGSNCAPPGSSPPATIAPSVYQIPLLPPMDERARRLGLPFTVPR